MLLSISVTVANVPRTSSGVNVVCFLVLDVILVLASDWWETWAERANVSPLSHLLPHTNCPILKGNFPTWIIGFEFRYKDSIKDVVLYWTTGMPLKHSLNAVLYQT